jgi:hypothetical protein
MRERVYILAASKDQAAIFARRWVAEGEGRGLADAVYLTRYNFDGLMVSEPDRIVRLEGFHLNRDAHQLECHVRRALAKTGLTWEDIELEAAAA